MTTELFASALAIAIAAGISPYATVAVLGAAQHFGWIGALPGALGALTTTWVLTLAIVLTCIEFVATLVPGIASAWEAVHATIRPPAAIVMAVLVAWGGDTALVVATGLVAGVVAFGTSLTKLGARLAIDTSPEPFSNGAANVAELSLVAAIAVFVWQHPILAFVAALAIVVVFALLVRAVWGLIWQTVTRNRRPGAGSIRS